MAETFQETSVTLLQRIAVEKTGEDQAAWARFFELYEPAMLKFAEYHGGGAAAEDVVQEVLVKLVDILRNGRFEIERGTKFRSFLATLIRNQLADHYRREQVRGAGRKVPLKDWSASVEPEAAARLDVEWRLARHRAALDHVLTKTALAKQSKEIYADYVLRELPIEEVAEKYGVSRNLVSQIKSRVDRMVAAVEAEYEDSRIATDCKSLILRTGRL